MLLGFIIRNSQHCTLRSSRSHLLIHQKNGKILLPPVRYKSVKADGTRESIKLPKKDVARLFSLAKSEKLRLAGAIGLLVISSGVTMSVPFALGQVVDIIYNMDQLKDSSLAEQKEAIRQRLNKVCLALCAIFMVGATANFGRVYLMRLAGQNITANLRNKVYTSIVKQEVSFFDKTRTGEIINRLSADTQLVSQTITQQVSDGMRSSFMTLAGVGMMFYMSPQLAAVGLGIVPPVALWAVWMGKRVKTISKEVQSTLAEATGLAEEKISNIRTVRIFAKEEEEIAAYNRKMDNVLDKAIKESLIQAKFYGMTGLSGNMIIITVLYYGGNLVTSDAITVGNLASFVLYAAYVGIGLSGVSTFYAETMKGLGASSRLFEIIDKHPEIPISGGLIPASSNLNEIAFKNVQFAYPTRPDVNILKGLDLCIPGDTIVAIVGPSGSGKSTISNLLLRLYEPSGGEILLNKNNIKNIDPSWLRKYIGTVSQEPVLFNTSIKKNILYGVDNPELISVEKLENAAREANAHDFIANFPEGYETMVGERGVMLSGGQKQRIAIARAIIKNPAILLLDEATSALDAKSEHEVKIALDRIMKGRSVITIAHRLSTIKNADLIAVLDGGCVAEIGTFDQLMKKPGGKFESLVKQQIKGFQHDAA